MTAPALDWLSQLMSLMTVCGRLEIRCAYGAPWQVVYKESAPGEMPYHVILRGSAVLDLPGRGGSQPLAAGDIVMMPHGSAHVLHDGSGAPPTPARQRKALNLVISENTGTGERLDMLCGRFVISPPHDRFVRDYLPTRLVVRTSASGGSEPSPTSTQLASLVALMRAEASAEYLGGQAMLNALSAALFALTLRMASESSEAPTGLLALAGHPRVAPALMAMLGNPAHPWSLPELAERCNMSRATLVRHFQEKVGRSASDLLTDIRMAVAANELKKPGISTELVAETVGYQSVAAFRRAFAQRMGMTPGDWRRLASKPGQSADDAA
jgi:AraC family transcriptional regulator, activator of mtrCDE